MTPPATPAIRAPAGPTDPEAGVIVAKPATIPVIAPSPLGFPYLIHSTTIHVTAPVAAEICVTNIAIPAEPSAASALPALKPNQPTHSIPAPVKLIVRLCGIIGEERNPCLGPSTTAVISAPTPAVIWTTVPPAKSINPISANHPPPQTQLATGK